MRGNIYIVFYDRIVPLIEYPENFFKWLFRKITTRSRYLFLAGDYEDAKTKLKKFCGFEFVAWREAFIRELSQKEYSCDVFIIVAEFSIKSDYEWALQYYFGNSKIPQTKKRSFAQKAKEEWEYSWMERGINFLIGYNTALDRFIWQEIPWGHRSLFSAPIVCADQSLEQTVEKIVSTMI